MTTNELDSCSLCPRTRREHVVAERDKVVHHKFAEVGGTLQRIKEEKKDKKSPVQSPFPLGDPVLRIVLIEKGVISVDDIEKAEQKLKATGVLRTHADPAVGH